MENKEATITTGALAGGGALNPKQPRFLSGILNEDALDALEGTKTAKTDVGDLPTAPDDLIKAHWDLHKDFLNGEYGGTALDAVAEEHAEIVDALYEAGLVHPPPPDTGLDEASTRFEKYKNNLQPQYWLPPAEWNQKRKSLGDLSEIGLRELRKFVLPSISEALVALEGPYEQIEKAADGVMLALFLEDACAREIAIKDGEAPEQLHCTIGYFGKADMLPIDFIPKAKEAIADVAARWAPLVGSLGGTGRFNASATSDGNDVVYASVDVPGLTELRADLLKEVEMRTGVKASRKHGYSPHVTLGYVPPTKKVDVRLDTTEVLFTEVYLARGPAKQSFKLSGTRTEKRAPGLYETRITFPILKLHDEERLMIGVVLEPDEVDAQDDTVKSPVIKNAAHRFLSNFGRTGGSRLGLMHKQFGDIGFALAESWVQHEDTIIGGEKVKKGSWLMGVKALSDELWAKVKRGELTGFSIGGVASMVAPD
jgi:2'-5' RNA ligase